MKFLSDFKIHLARNIPGNKTVDFTKIIKKPQKILCFPAQGDGELLLAIPALHALRRHYRDSLITLLINEDKRGLWNFDNEADEIIDYRPGLMKSLFSAETRRLRKIFIERQFDLLIDFGYQCSDLMSYVFSTSGIEVRYGMNTGKDHAFKNFLIKAGNLSQDEIHRNLQMIRPLGAHLGGQHIVWPKLVGLEGKREFKEKLKEEGLKKGQSVLIADCSSWNGADLIAQTAVLLKNQHLKLVLLNPDKKIDALLLGKAMVMNSPSPAEIVEALSQAKAFIGTKNDIFALSYVLKVPSLIVVPPNTKGIPLPGEQLQISYGKIPFELPETVINEFIQKYMKFSIDKHRSEIVS